jgi:hypothetical protein
MTKTADIVNFPSSSGLKLQGLHLGSFADQQLM